jgi:hypothetical protein
MFTRGLTFVIAMSFMFSVPAGAATHADSLRSAMNELNYALNVEWDQKDPAFYDAQMNRFQSVMVELSAQGMTQEEMLLQAKGLVKDTRTAAELEKTLQLISANKLTNAEAKKLVMEMIAQSHSRGANWSGEIYMSLGTVIALVLVIAVLAGGGSGDGTSTGGGVNTCAYGYHYQCYSYFDQFGIYRWMSGCDFVWSCL